MKYFLDYARQAKSGKPSISPILLTLRAFIRRSTIMENRSTALFALLASIITTFYYVPFLNNFFVFDDFRMIENIFRGTGATLLGYDTVRVVANLSFVPLYFLSGLNPLGYNLFNVTLHFVNSLLIFFFINHLFKSTTLSFLVGIIFIASGVGSDAIFWKISNCTLLSLAFCLVTLILYTRWRQEHKKNFYLWSIFTFLLAMFSKEDAATLPILIVLLEILFWGGWQEKISAIKRIVPFCIIVFSYLLTAQILIRIFGVNLEAFTVFFKFRPLYSLFGGFTVFFIHPSGSLGLVNPFIYITAVLIPLTFFFVKEKKLLAFGYGWIFIAFLPSSFMTVGLFNPVYVLNSISRYLYMSSVGSSIVFAAILISFRERFSNKIFMAVCALFFVIFVAISYSRVQDRGMQWQGQGKPMRGFLYSLKEVLPTIPENSYVHVKGDVGAGRAYIQQSLRAFYRNSKIYWTNDPHTVKLKNGEQIIIIFYRKETAPALASNDDLSVLIYKGLPEREIKMLYYTRMDNKELNNENLNHAISNIEQRYEVLSSLGYLYYNIKNNNRAINSFKEALKINPSDYRLKEDLALIYEGQGQLKEAKALFEEALLLERRPEQKRMIEDKLKIM